MVCGMIRTLLAVLSLVGGCLCLGVVQAQTPDALRPPVSAVLQSAQALLGAGKAQDAKTALQELERKIPDLSMYERYISERLRAAVLLALGDDPGAVTATEAALGTGKATPEERRTLLAQLTGYTQKLNRHEDTLRWAAAYLEAGGQDDAVRGAMVRAALARGECKPALEQLTLLVVAAERQGTKPPESQLRAVAACHAKLGNQDGYYRSLIQLLEHHPSKAYWTDAVARLQHRPEFADRLVLDAFRLMRHVGVMEDPDDIMSHAQLAVAASLPGEARGVLQAGFDAGRLGQGAAAGAQRELLARVSRLAQADQAQLDESERTAQKQSDGRQLFLVGQAAMSYGQAERGLKLMEAAVQRGIAKNGDDAKLQLAVALASAGRSGQARSRYWTGSDSELMAEPAAPG